MSTRTNAFLAQDRHWTTKEYLLVRLSNVSSRQILDGRHAEPLLVLSDGVVNSSTLSRSVLQTTYMMEGYANWKEDLYTAASITVIIQTF